MYAGNDAVAHLNDPIENLWTTMRTSKIPGLPQFLSQFVIWLMLPGLVLWVAYYIPIGLSKRFKWLQGKGKYLQFLWMIWGATYFLPALIFLTSQNYGTVCDLYNKNITPQLAYTDAIAVCLIMALHMIVEQADMKEGIHATGTLLIGTLIPYPIFLYFLAKKESKGYKVTDAQRWARWLFLGLGLVTLFVWIVPLVQFWNTYHVLDLRHSGVGLAPDHASAWATGVVTVGWFMFSVWAIPQIKSLFWAYIFIVIGICHLGLIMGLFLFIRLSEPAAKFFLKSPVGDDDVNRPETAGDDLTSSSDEGPLSASSKKGAEERKASPSTGESGSRRSTRIKNRQ